MGNISITFAIPEYFPGNINSAFGFISAGAAVGMMVFPPVMQFLIQQYGWRGALLLLGAINANNIVCGFLLQPHCNKNDTKHELLNSQYETDDDKNHPFMTLIKDRMNTFKAYLHFLLVENPKFVSIMIADLLSGLLFAAWVIFLVPHAISKGISPQLSSFLSTSGALGALVGRLIMGPSIKSGYVTAIQLFIILGFVNAVAFVLDLFSDSFMILATLAFINGLACGTLMILSFGATAEILGEEHAVDGYSMASVCYPVGSLLGGVILGKSCFSISRVLTFSNVIRSYWIQNTNRKALL